MSKFWHYIGNIAEMIVVLFFEAVLEGFYFLPNRSHFNFPGRAVVLALITVVALAIAFWLYKRQLRDNNEWGFNRSPHWDARRIGIALLGTVLLFFASAALLYLIQKNGGGSTSQNQAALDRLAKKGNINLYKIMVAFLAPFLEEIIFRGMFFNTFFTKPSKLNKWLGIIVSAFVFAYLHDRTFTQFFFVYWALGLILGWIYMQTKDLRYSMLAHMLYNGLGFLG